MSQMLVRVTKEMDEALKELDSAETIANLNDWDSRLDRVRELCETVVREVYKQWREK